MHKINFRVFDFRVLVFVCLLFLKFGCPVFAQNTLRGSVVATTPSIATATSVTVLTAKLDRLWMLIQNNSAANICCSLNGAVLTGIVPSATNICLVIPPAGNYSSPANLVTTDSVTCYQTSGATINTIYIHQG